MKKEHYPSLELCKKLTEARFPKTEEMLCTQGQNNTIDPPDCVYPSAMELLDEMPGSIYVSDFEEFWISIGKDGCRYSGQQRDYKIIQSNSVPNNLANMWIWLKENDYIS